MNRTIIAEYWESFRLAVVPPDASVVQRDEMRKAFYAGAHATFCGLVALRDPRKKLTQKDICELKSIGQELKEFAESL